MFRTEAAEDGRELNAQACSCLTQRGCAAVGCSIETDSEPGKGSTFTVRIRRYSHAED